MDRESHSFSLDLSFDVIFTRSLFDAGNDVLACVFEGAPANCLVFIDEGVARAWPRLCAGIEGWASAHPETLRILAIETVSGGEQIKNDFAIVDHVGALASRHGLCRHSYVMVIGGGAVLDAVGFAAALIHRGIRLIRVPTTVLAQQDSGVGVKNGVNRFGSKNFYGTFVPPRAVINDFEFTRTLSDRIFISGVSEAFKVGTIRDAAFLEYLIGNTAAIRARDDAVCEYMIRRCAELHVQHIMSGGDPFETGTSRPLDFGHWSAHKLEVLTGFELLHGEAVAIGMGIDLHVASYLGFIRIQDAERVCRAMHAVGLPLTHKFLSDRFLQVLEGLDEFREHLGGELTLAMPRPLGHQKDIHDVDPDLIRRAAEALSAFSNDALASADAAAS
jgi:3-dehydroquinate synthase